jgi:hypothetical protein
MEKDKHLQQLLQASAERSSVSFTQTVMSKIEFLSYHTISYKPLIPARLKRIFISFYVGLVLTIVVICLIIAVPVVPFLQSISVPVIPSSFSRSAFTGLILFWIIFGVNFLYKKRLLLQKKI